MMQDRMSSPLRAVARWRHTAPAAIVLALAAALLMDLAVQSADASSVRGTVVATSGGDGVRVKVGDSVRSYRLLGVAAPSGDACFARDAQRRLAALLRKGKRVRVVTDRRAPSRRHVWVFAGRSLVNQKLVAGGHATVSSARGLRYGARLSRAQRRAETGGRGLWQACRQDAPQPPAGPGSSPPSPAPAPTGDRKQQDIATMGEALKGVHVFTLQATNNPSGFNTSTREDLELCSDGRFVYRSLRTESSDGFGPIRTEVVSGGTWRVVDANVDPATGAREALIDGAIDQGSGIGETVRVYVRANADGVSGRWNDQAAEFSRSQSCA